MKMETKCLKGINTLRYSDIFLAMYSDNGSTPPAQLFFIPAVSFLNKVYFSGH